MRDISLPRTSLADGGARGRMPGCSHIPMAFSHREEGPCATCAVVQWLTTLLLFCSSVASFLGVIRTHFPPSGLNFSSPQGGVYLLVFCVSLFLWSKAMKKCCGCTGSCCR